MSITCHTGRSQGFTLAELVIVLTILAVTAGLSLPRLAGFLEPDALKEAGAILSRHVVLARDQALLRQERWGVLVDLDARTVRAQCLDAAATIPATPEPLPRGVSFKSLAVGGDTFTSGQAVIRLLPLGLAEPCRITLQNADNGLRRLELRASDARLVQVAEFEGSDASPSGNPGTHREPIWETLP